MSKSEKPVDVQDLRKDDDAIEAARKDKASGDALVDALREMGRGK
jgi:hypothetical protein